MNITEKLRETAARVPAKPAYYFAGESKSYAELEGAVTKFASGLQKIGIQKGDHVGLILGNSPYFVIGLYGALRAGATVVPMNPLYTPTEIGYMLDNGDVKALIALDLVLPVLEKVHTSLPKVESFILCETPKQEGDSPLDLGSLSIYPKLQAFTEVLEKGDLSFAPVDVKEDDTAVILYTSGTTGKPKGAMLTHKNLFSNAHDIAEYLKFNEEDRVITALPMFHVFCLTVALNAPLMKGATLLIVPRFSPKEIFDLGKTMNPTVFAGVPTMYNFLYQYPEGNPDDLKSLRLCVSGGASMPVALLKNFEHKFKVVVSEGYGLSEASPVATFNPLDRPRKPGSIGTSINNVENKVVDATGEEVPIGQVGELIVKGPNVMKGYYKLQEETVATIKDGWLYTGDLARMDEEGYLYIVDRKKDMIVVGGYNVYPREVEEVLYNHPDIVEAAVVGIPDPAHGEAVKSFVVSNNPDLTADDLIEYCSLHLAKYKLPSYVEFIDELPKNATGKILRRSLKEIAVETK
ncbi:long-chain acyl-CoA synthetase [Bacillus oleivorans]|uniref:Long-chain acyl-CoA synthetase n=1 Tax=Bacillus oleivorans TaxID=1448271 RepID=A0A285CSL8_9BACI|nr:fatty acid--CoA ligase family protein [Bacillus oleivorans]SNX70038.1 long-chain acyl-CoA synthetase [Bacillus oleivorans]